MQGGHHLHTCTTSTSQGGSYGETSQTLNAQRSTRVHSDGVGASENPRKLKRERKHTGRTTIHET